MSLKSLLLLSICLMAGNLSASPISERLDAALQGEHRVPAFVERDQYRHPQATLTFFELEPDMTVVEIWPGGGWYTEILAPTLREQGILYEAGFSMTAERTPDWRKDYHKQFTDKLAARPDVYDHVVVTELSIPERTTIAPPGTADRVFTFRNVHNWMKGDYAPAMFDVFYKTLKPGGILGIVEHRAKPGTSLEDMIESGYVTEAHVKKLARDAGFIFEVASEINANPQDMTDHPAGVWTLPPSLRFCKRMDEGPAQDACFVKYQTIGESDRMTLKFRKPEKQ